jgi:integrase/recombinase XerD
MKITIRNFKNQLAIRNYSQRTIESYISVVERMCKFCNKKPAEITESDYRKFVEHLVYNTNLSWNTIHVFHGGIAYFFREILKNEKYRMFVKYPKRMIKLPIVMSYTEIRQIFHQVTNFKHNTMLKLLYSTGIRSSELRFLTLECIDFERRTLKINGGKNRRDRYVVISHVMKNQLIEYLEKYQPSYYLFESQKNNSYYSGSALRYILWQAKRKLKITKPINIHCFRHSFATHMLEQGGNILVLQRLLGHVHLNATLVYLHVQNVDITRAPNPLDNLELCSNNYLQCA